MNVTVVAVKDLGAQTFGRPWFVKTDAVAIRAFTQEVNTPVDMSQNPSANPWSHPDDFELYALGTFNDDTGELVPFKSPQLLLQAKHVSERSKGASTPVLDGGYRHDGKMVSM